MIALFLLTPAYLLANLHCFGMCGPIAMMLNRLKFRHYYFLGRVTGFTLAGFLAGLSGSLFVSLQTLSPLFSFLLAFFLFFVGLMMLFHWSLPLPKTFHRFTHLLTSLALKDQPRSLFLFGLATLLLPCGQTLVVLSASALFQNGFLGALNGLFFSLLTTPSLLIAMAMGSLLQSLKRFTLIAQVLFAWIVAFLALLRGFAELGIIDHLSLSSTWHLVLF